MENTQNSNVFSTSSDSAHSFEYFQMDASYEILVSNTKSNLGKDIQSTVKKSMFSTHFTSILEDCNSCISQSLNSIIGLLADTDAELNKLNEYMDDVVCLLQMLSKFIMNVVETMSITCSNMRTFPTTTGYIIHHVFIHCKNSVSLYGIHLFSMEKQLKHLFKTCHELQLTYLMILERHFIFDFFDKDQDGILIEALDINLKIGEIVQGLDVKTMAEQWKACTAICEKHADRLMDKHIFNNCSRILCEIMRNNINTALQKDQDETTALRSLKITNFTIKILLKMNTIFKHCATKDYSNVTELLLHTHLHNPDHLELFTEKSVANHIKTKLLNPSELLLTELFPEEKFANYLLEYDINELNKGNKLLGYMLLIISSIKYVLQNTAPMPKHFKSNIIQRVYSLLPFCHVWFNIGLKFDCQGNTDCKQTYGLYEHLLTHTTALALTLNSEEHRVLEKCIYEALLSVECYSAVFSSDLWVLLARKSDNSHLLLYQLIYLYKIYQQLDKNTNNLFKFSPQNVHLSNTMSRLFQVMSAEDSCLFYSMVNEYNANVWSIVKPNDVQNSNGEVDIEKLRKGLRKFDMSRVKSSEEMYNLIKTTNVSASCLWANIDCTVASDVVESWTKLCPMDNVLNELCEDVTRDNVWYVEYTEGLIILTKSTRDLLKSSDVVKVLHVMSGIIKTGNKELKLLLIEEICKMYICQVDVESTPLVHCILVETFKFLLQDDHKMIKDKLFYVLNKYKSKKRLNSLITKICKENDNFKVKWNSFMDGWKLKDSSAMEWKDQLLLTLDLNFSHRCVRTSAIELSGPDCVREIKKSNSSNYDFGDIFNYQLSCESETEQPACKKAKLNCNGVEETIVRLENDASLICNMKEKLTNEHKHRIRNVCNVLTNIFN